MCVEFVLPTDMTAYYDETFTYIEVEFTIKIKFDDLKKCSDFITAETMAALDNPICKWYNLA